MEEKLLQELRVAAERYLTARAKKGLGCYVVIKTPSMVRVWLTSESPHDIAERVRLRQAQSDLVSGLADAMVAQVAAWNEFGTEYIPERPFLRTALMDNEANITSDRNEALTKMALEGWGAQKALGLMGLRIQIYIQNQIKSNMPPPNSQATQDRKTRIGVAQRTLIETEHLLKSITYRVVVGGGSKGGHGK